MKPRSPFLIAAGLVGTIGALLLGLSLWMVKYGYAWELRRCGRLPNEYYPEIGWAFFVASPAAIALFCAITAVLVEMRCKPERAWVGEAILITSGLACTAAVTFSLLGEVMGCPATG